MINTSEQHQNSTTHRDVIKLADRERCRLDHLVPLLQLLQPRGVIAPHGAACQALDDAPGPWSAHPMSIQGRSVSDADAAAVHQTLHTELGLARHRSCDLPA